MTVYKSTKTTDTYPYRGGYVDEEGNAKPESIRVTARKLTLGDIVLIHDYRESLYRSATVSGIDKLPNPSYSKKWKITLVDGKGKVDVFEVGDGKIWEFERQCSQEVRENVEERSRNISLRRDIQRLERKVVDLAESMDWFKKNGGKNPKMPAYLKSVLDFHTHLGAMYDDVGNDLGLAPRSKKKKQG